MISFGRIWFEGRSGSGGGADPVIDGFGVADLLVVGDQAGEVPEQAVPGQARAELPYSCDPGPDPDLAVQCVSEQTVVFGGAVGAAGTITVTNTFSDEPQDEEVDDEVDDDVDDVVAATPPFTG